MSTNLNVEERADGTFAVKRMPEDELRALAGRAVRNEIWLGLDEASLRGFLFLRLSGILPDDTGLVWEDMSHAGEHSINGCPIFLSVGGFVHTEDTEFFLRETRTMLRATGVSIPSEEELQAAWAARAAGDEQAVDRVVEEHRG